LRRKPSFTARVIRNGVQQLEDPHIDLMSSVARSGTNTAPACREQYCGGVNDAGACRGEDPAFNKHLILLRK